MKQTIFENRQRAEELLREALRIWRQSDHPDQLEGVEQDPVFALLMTALAYQSNETEASLEHMKSDVLTAFEEMLTPYEVGHAIPATAVIQTKLQSGIPSMMLDENSVFKLGDPEVQFIPLLRTQVLNASINSVIRLDGRRWKVSLQFDMPITDLSGFSFAIKNHNYRDLKVTIKGQTLPLITAQDFSELPLNKCFDIDTILYNKSQTYTAAVSCLDLFARHNIRAYFVKTHKPTKFIPSETDSIDLIFEFNGISDGFLFDKENLLLNTVFLVNAYVRTAELSSRTPIVRVAGFESLSTDADGTAQQFMHMIRPSSDLIYGNVPVDIRKIAADRFNQGSLVSLLNMLISRYYTDFYAFQNLRQEANDKVMQNLIEILTRMRDAARRDLEQRVPGVYLMLRPQPDQSEPVSLSISYVTTLGSAANPSLIDNQITVFPPGLNQVGTSLLAPPIQGTDEVRDRLEEESLSRYYMITNDRLVTPADLKLFCYNELQTRYGITHSMVESINVSHRQMKKIWEAGYEIFVDIVLKNNSFILRGFESKITQTEALFKAMMSVRSTNIYPIEVSISINQNK